MHKKTIVCVEVNSDTTEGRGPMKMLALFSDRGVAESVMLDPRFRRFNVQGIATRPDDLTYNCKEYVIYDTPEDFWDYQDGKVRQNALAKLTKEEREALGLA